MTNSFSKPKIFVVGFSFTQNELLARYIETSLGYPSVSCQEINQILLDDIKCQKIIILLDLRDNNWRSVSNNIKQEIGSRDGVNQCFIALFNVIPANGIEKEIVNIGISGIFYIDSSLDLLLKGIKAILRNELWLPRSLINTIFLSHQKNNTYSSAIAANISLREKQVLDLLSNGYTNDMIADKLCVSIHTVKTHIYNIYRKINVRNRLQAVRWVNDHLSALK